MKRYFGWMALALALAAVASALATAGEPKPGDIDAFFVDFDHTSSPGCSVGVFHRGQLVFAKGYGMASLELGVPNTGEMFVKPLRITLNPPLSCKVFSNKIAPKMM